MTFSSLNCAFALEASTAQLVAHSPVVRGPGEQHGAPVPDLKGATLHPPVCPVSAPGPTVTPFPVRLDTCGHLARTCRGVFLHGSPRRLEGNKTTRPLCVSSAGPWVAALVTATGLCPFTLSLDTCARRLRVPRTFDCHGFCGAETSTGQQSGDVVSDKASRRGKRLSQAEPGNPRHSARSCLWTRDPLRRGRQLGDERAPEGKGLFVF